MQAIVFTRRLAIATCAAALAGCSTSGGSSSSANTGDPEKDLRIRSAALQRTIFEAAATGAVVGPGFYYRRTVKVDQAALARSAAAGAALGGAAGLYTAWLQQEYANKEDQLERVKSDLDANAAEIQATINVMRDVLALQQQDLNRIRSQASAGGDGQALATEVAAAQANLGEMQKAIAGASRREQEFAATRGLVAVGGGATIDPELKSLSNQIAAMKSIATDLAESI